MSDDSDPSNWWTPEREARWEHLDEVREAAEEEFNRYRDGRGWVSIGTHAPNPHGINGDETPANWYWSVGRIINGIEKIQSLLSERIGDDVIVKEKPDGWDDGYWLVVDE